MSLKYATPTQTANVDAFGNSVRTPDLVRDNRSSAASPNTASVSQQSQTSKGNANLDGNSNRVTNDPVSNPNGKNNTNRVGGGGNSVGNKPYTPKPVNNPSTTAPNSAPSNSAAQVSSPVTGVSKLAALLNSPVGKALGAVAAIAGAVSAASDIGTELGNLNNAVSGQADRNKAARKTLDDATKRLELAQANRQNISPANSKGSYNEPNNANYVPPFSGGQLADIYIVSFDRYLTKMQGGEHHQDSSSFSLRGAITGSGFRQIGQNENGKIYEWFVLGSGGTHFQQITTVGDFGSNLIVSGRTVIKSVVRQDGFADTGGNVPNPNPPSNTSVPPLDREKVKDDLKDPNNPYSPNYFPYLPSLPIANNEALQPNLQPNPANDNLPFKEPEKPNFSPAIPSPIQSPVSNLANSSPAFTSPSLNRPASPVSVNPNSGTQQPYASPAVDGGVFSARPFVSGVSDPSEYGNPKDIKTGLTREQFEQAKQAKLNEPRIRAANADAKIMEEQLRNLSNVVRNGETKSAQQVQREQYENSISGDPIKLAAYQQAQSKASITVAPVPVVTPKTTTPNTPASPDLGTIATILGTIGLALSAIGQRTTKIDGQTTPQAQQTNAKQGVCDAMQPQQCGFEGVKQATTEATAPIKAQTTANAGLLAQVLAAIANLASTMATVLSNLGGKLDGIRQFLEKVARSAKLDKIYGLLTFITVIHNAQMLSNSLATTLMDSLSLGLATIGIKDENESPIDIQSIINKSVEDTVKGIVGTANYTTLSDRWKQAVRVYQAAANITYQVRSLWDSAKSLAELTGANVGKIGNALRRDGAVSENAYTAMADNPLMVNSAMSRLQNLEEAASHLNSITSEAYSVTETVTQIKKDQDDFKKLVKESKPLLSVPNDAAKAKDDAAKLVSVSPSISNIDLVKP